MNLQVKVSLERALDKPFLCRIEFPPRQGRMSSDGHRDQGAALLLPWKCWGTVPRCSLKAPEPLRNPASHCWRLHTHHPGKCGGGRAILGNIPS